ncbi:unnamed protein product [Owenia fusiformis]|uniref:cholesterol 7-desaturase n=1 Tax=Owenia fusiformis TaxID=6347 RepID=A0A8J1XVL6_OWEFU|nr:unnamed protein product [Owenia fusiformis]
MLLSDAVPQNVSTVLGVTHPFFYRIGIDDLWIERCIVYADYRDRFASIPYVTGSFKQKVNIPEAVLLLVAMSHMVIVCKLIPNGSLQKATCERLIFWAPLERIRQLSDVGYYPDSRMSMKDTANMVKRWKSIGDVPPVYPNGWFAVIESHKLPIKAVKNTHLLGMQLCVFRDENGEAHVIDAYCPHMGANLAVGGVVKGDCVECPFHAWRFRGEDGKCTHIPYAEKAPEVAKVKSWPVSEMNGFVHMWYHAEDLDPQWMIPEIETIASGQFVYRGRTEHHVNAHIEEIPENGADVAHLGHLHSPSITLGIDVDTIRKKYWDLGVQHNWDAQWEPLANPDKKHISTIKLKHKMTLFGIAVPILDLKVYAEQIGPGIVYMHWTSVLGSGIFQHYLTPEEPLEQKLVHNIYTDWRMPPFISKFFLMAEAIQVERDMSIWNNKKFISKPVLSKSKECSMISKHRRWYSQFYSENSPRLKFQKDTLDW